MSYEFVLAGPLWDQLRPDQQAAISGLFVGFLKEFGVPTTDETCQSSALVFAMMASAILAQMSPNAVEIAFRDINESLRINTDAAIHLLEHDSVIEDLDPIKH